MDRIAALHEIEALLRRHTDERAEERIITLLAGLDDRELDAVIRTLDLVVLLESVDDHLFGAQHRDRLLDLIARDRLNALSVPAKAALVRALQRGHTCQRDERAVRDILVHTRGAELAELKRLVHLQGGYHDLAQLLRHDLDDARLVAEILAHFRAEAEGMRPAPLKVLSDIDDTIVCQLHDRRYPRGTVYPGVVALHQALSRGPLSPARGSLTLVTARPGDRLGLVESRTIQEVRAYGLEQVAVLTGDVDDLLSHTDMARGKYENILSYREIFPESPFVWIGDNGQGDAILGGWLMSEPELEVRGSFIHDVLQLPPEERAAWAEKGVALFRTYAGAALLAYETGLIDGQGLCAVCEAALADLRALNLDAERSAAREAELEEDLAAARRALDRTA